MYDFSKLKDFDDLVLTIEDGVTELPDNLPILSNLFIRGTQIKELPKNLKVLDILDIVDTPITQIPKDIQVGDYPYLKANISQFTYIPNGIPFGISDFRRDCTVMCDMKRILKRYHRLVEKVPTPCNRIALPELKIDDEIDMENLTFIDEDELFGDDI